MANSTLLAEFLFTAVILSGSLGLLALMQMRARLAEARVRKTGSASRSPRSLDRD